MLNFRGFSISLFHQFDHQFCIADVIFPVLNLFRPGFRFFCFYLRFFSPAGIKNGSNHTQQGGQGGNDLYHIHNVDLTLFSAVNSSDIFPSDR